MKLQREVLEALRTSGVDSVGIYVVNGQTCIALHCKNEEIRKKNKEYLEQFLEDEVIL